MEKQEAPLKKPAKSLGQQIDDLLHDIDEALEETEGQKGGK